MPRKKPAIAPISWTPELVATLRQQYEAGKPMREIAAALGGTFDAVRGKVREQGFKRVKARQYGAGGYQVPYREWQREDMIRWNLLHLLDLKRAGHSPTHTELHIPSDGKVMLIADRNPGSSSSSPLSW
jgi:hypothetical protein